MSSQSASASSASIADIDERIALFVTFLRRQSIRCVVFDMDRTLVANHSGGCVSLGQVSAFAASLTPAARHLIPVLLAEGFHIAVATFADDLYGSFYKDEIAGVELVHIVLRELPCFATGDALAAVPVVTLNPDLYAAERVDSEEQRRMKGTAVGGSKQPSKLEAFFSAKIAAFGLDSSHADWSECAAFPPAAFKNHHLTLIAAKLGLDRRELMLIDDRDDNVDAAVSAGAWGLYLTKKRGLLMEDLHERNTRGPSNGAK